MTLEELPFHIRSRISEQFYTFPYQCNQIRDNWKNGSNMNRYIASKKIGIFFFTQNSLDYFFNENKDLNNKNLSRIPGFFIANSDGLFLDKDENGRDIFCNRYKNQNLEERFIQANFKKYEIGDLKVNFFPENELLISRHIESYKLIEHRVKMVKDVMMAMGLDYDEDFSKRQSLSDINHSIILDLKIADGFNKNQEMNEFLKQRGTFRLSKDGMRGLVINKRGIAYEKKLDSDNDYLIFKEILEDNGFYEYEL